MRNYPSKEYKAAVQNWALLQDKRGVMYFANDQGILEYDGKNWVLIPTTNNSPVRSLAIDNQGVVYVGGSGEMGFLAPKASGQLEYISLKKYLPKNTPEFEDVYTTHATDEGIYFHTDKFIFLFNPNSQKTQIWLANADSFFFLTFYVNHKLYVHDQKVGLMAIHKGQIKLIRGGDFFKEERIYTILPYDSEKLLIGTRKKGLFVYNPISLEDKELIREFDTPAKDFLLKNQLYNGAILPDNEFALCTREGGLLILDKLGNIKGIYDEKLGLIDHNVRSVYMSKEGILWFAFDNGISQMNLNLPIRFWDTNAGLKGTIRAITEHNKILYVATSLGVYYLEEDKFKEIPEIATESWTLLNYKIDEENSELLAGTNDGIYLIKDKHATLVHKTSPFATLSLYASPYRKGLVYAGLKGGFLVLQRKESNWLKINTEESVKDEIYSIVETPQGQIWLGTFIQGVASIELDNKFNPVNFQRFGIKNGLPTLRSIQVFYFDKRLFFGTNKGLYQFDANSRRFTTDSYIGQTFANGSRGVYRLVNDYRQNAWLSEVNTENHSIGVALRQKNKSFLWNDTILRRLPEFSEPYIYPANNGLVWIGGSEDLFVYDQNRTNRNKQSFSVLIRKVMLNEDSLIFGGNFYKKLNNAFTERVIDLKQPKSLKPTFAFQPKFSLDFYCAAPFFDNEADIEYSYALLEELNRQPNQNDWSAWTKDIKKQYTNLREGNYVFYVKARNVYGEISEIAKFEFNISPPWYRTTLAYVFYVLLGIGLVAWLIYLNSLRLLKQQARLQRLVEERTHEISEKSKELEKQSQEIMIQATKLQVANEEITKQKTEIEEQNKDITDSINYASRVQGAMFPSLDKMKKIFPNSFVIYKPRDIVSGDFYWFAETPLEPRFAKDPNIKNGTVSIFKGFAEGKKIVAAVDCTGHGIPAALVSMIGDSFLNQIVNFEGIKQAHLILQELDFYIRHTLNQDEGESMDGMDMALCVIDPNNATLEYAGAKNPLVYVQNGEVKVIKGDKYGIGGFQMEKTDKIFTRHIIDIDKPTSIYLFSDGFEDQFGGPKGKKFLLKRMTEIFAAQHGNRMEDQKIILEQTLADWMEGYEQLDDILLMGIHLEPQDFEDVQWVSFS